MKDMFFKRWCNIKQERMEKDEEGVLVRMRTSQGDAIKSLFQVLKDVSDTCTMSFGDEHISLFCLNMAGSCAVSAKIDCERLDDYVCQKPMKLGIDVASVHRYLSFIDKNETLTLQVNEDDPVTLVIRFHHRNVRQSTKTEISTMDFQDDDIDEDLSIDKQNNDWITLKMTSDDLQKNVRMVSQVSSEIEFKYTQGYVYFSFASEKHGAKTFRCWGLSEEGGGEDVVHCVSKVSGREGAIIVGKYKIAPILSCSKASCLHNSVEIELINDHPLILRYQAADLGTLTFLIGNLE